MSEPTWHFSYESNLNNVLFICSSVFSPALTNSECPQLFRVVALRLWGMTMKGVAFAPENSLCTQHFAHDSGAPVHIFSSLIGHLVVRKLSQHLCSIERCSYSAS